MKITNANSKNIEHLIYKRLNFVYKNKKTEFDIAKFDQQFEQLTGTTKVATLKSGVELSGSALNILRYNAEQAEVQKDVMEYNSQVSQARKIEEANFARISGTIARRRGDIAALGSYARAGESLLRIGQATGKIPTE